MSPWLRFLDFLPSRNFYASWPQLGVPAGLISSAAIFGAFSSLSDQQFYAWGWRMPFLISVVLIFVGVFIRMRVHESPASSRVKKLGVESKFPLRDVLRNDPVASILAVGVNLINLGAFYIVATFSLSFVTSRFGLGRDVPLVGVFLAGATEFVAILIFARMADRVGNRAVAIWGAGLCLLSSYPFFWLVDTGRPAFIWLAMSSFFLVGSAVYAVSGVLLAELFQTRVRYSGISFGYQMAGMLGGAPAPIIATALIHWSGGASWPVATYLAVMFLVSFVAVCLVAARYKEPIGEAQFTQPRLAGEEG